MRGGLAAWARAHFQLVLLLWDELLTCRTIKKSENAVGVMGARNMAR